MTKHNHTPDPLAGLLPPDPAPLPEEEANRGEDLANAVATMFSAFAIGLAPCVDATAGYKARLLDQGMSEPFAEAAALQYHQLLMQALSTNLFSSSK